MISAIIITIVNNIHSSIRDQTETFTTASSNNATSCLQNANGGGNILFGELISSIQEKGTSTLVIEFIETISKIAIFTEKKCVAEDDNSKSPSTTNVNLTCPTGEKPKPDPDAFTYNDFGIYDDAQEKQGFYFAVGPTIINGGFGVGGRAEVTANVGDVIEATASLQASLTGDLFLSLNEFGGYLRK